MPDTAHFAPPGPLGFGGAPLGNMFTAMDEATAEASLRRRLGQRHPLFRHRAALRRRPVGAPLRPCAAAAAARRIRALDQGRPAAGARPHRAAHASQVFVEALPFRPVYDYSLDGTLRSIEDSLQRLGLCQIDIAYIHDIAEDTHGAAWEGLFDQAMDGAARALTRLREEGVIRAWGLGVNLTEPCLRALDRADPDVFLLAGRYSLIDHAALDALFPACAARGVHVVVGGPFNSGLLAGGRTFDYAEAAPAEVAARDRVAAVCGRHGVDIRAAALQFCAAHPVVASVIPGAKGAARVRENAALMRAPIPARLLAGAEGGGAAAGGGADPLRVAAEVAHRAGRGVCRAPIRSSRPMTDPVPVRRALLSVSDKTGLVEFARVLAGQGAEILSTGGTAKALRDAGIPVKEVCEHTGFPEILDGRVKTLVPQVHGGLLGRRDMADHEAQMAEHGIAPIDLVAVNLYPFEATVAQGRRVRRLHREHRHRRPGDDPRRRQEPRLRRGADRAGAIRRGAGRAAAAGRHHAGDAPALAGEAYARTAAYDAAISGWFAERAGARPSRRAWPSPACCKQTLRYGENPHQQAASTSTATRAPASPPRAQVQGKELSYNNLNDTDAAYECVAEFDAPDGRRSSSTPIPAAWRCGELAEAWDRALRCDPVSAFGGIVAVNRMLDAAAAEKIAAIFTEVVVAPDADEAATGGVRPQEESAAAADRRRCPTRRRRA